MTLQEIIKSLDQLSVEDQTSLFQILRLKLSGLAGEAVQLPKTNGDNFWQGVLRFRETIEREKLIFTDADFADLRDPSPGREIEL